MSKQWIGLGFLGAALVFGSDVLGCGDKLVVVGRGTRPKGYRGPRQASILLYADPHGSLPAALEKGLRKDLEKAGHRLRSVETRQELEDALHTGTYDLVFVDFKAAPAVESEAQAAPSKPTVMPTLVDPSDADLAAARSHFHCAIKAPAEPKDTLSVVNAALAERAKQGSASGRK
jgi:DNA-binding NtrC family response regulator